MTRLGWYGRTVARTAAIVLGVLVVISALTLAAIGVLALVHHHHPRPSHVVTVTTTS